MTRPTPTQQETRNVTQGFGIIVTATGQWLNASDCETAVLVWLDEASALVDAPAICSARGVHGVVTPFQVR